MGTILARKVQVATPIAADDDAEIILISDPAITQFPSPNQGQLFGSTTNTTPGLTGAASSNAASDAEILVKADEHWVNSKWRPAMGWLYMATCLFDFILFPILWSILQALTKGSVTIQWQPLTLQGAGLYHIAMGAVLGIAAYGRTKEKISGG